MESLEKLFGSGARVKIMRLFLFNPDENYTTEDISKKTGVAKRTAYNECRRLKNAGLVKKKKFKRTVEKKLKTKTKKVKKSFKGYSLNKDFRYLLPLQNLLIKSEPLSQKGIEKRFKNSGNIKLLVVSGVFINEIDSRVDIMIVGDRLNTKSIEAAIRALESDIGRELAYTTFSTKEFKYRNNIYDKLIRDVLDYPHQKVVNKLGL